MIPPSDPNGNENTKAKAKALEETGAASGPRDGRGQMELRRKVAELCGWKILGPRSVNGPQSQQWRMLPWDEVVPNFPNDLNACHAFEKGMTDDQRVRYRIRLMFNSDGPKAVFRTVEAALCHATAEQRCRAYVKTMEATSVQENDKL